MFYLKADSQRSFGQIGQTMQDRRSWGLGGLLSRSVDPILTRLADYATKLLCRTIWEIS